MTHLELSILVPTLVENGSQKIEKSLNGEVAILCERELSLGVTCPEDLEVLCELLTIWPSGGMSTLTISPYNGRRDCRVELRVDNPARIKIIQMQDQALS